jgi:hypothetical protein
LNDGTLVIRSVSNQLGSICRKSNPMSSIRKSVCYPSGWRATRAVEGLRHSGDLIGEFARSAIRGRSTSQDRLCVHGSAGLSLNALRMRRRPGQMPTDCAWTAPAICRPSRVPRDATLTTSSRIFVTRSRLAASCSLGRNFVNRCVIDGTLGGFPRCERS